VFTERFGYKVGVTVVSFLFLVLGCQEGNEISPLPVVETIETRIITPFTATSGGYVTDDGGTPVATRGVCWDIESMPTARLNTKTADGSGKGSFASDLTGLIPGRIYHVRAYAINDQGTSYGSEVVFTTKKSDTVIYEKDGRKVRYGDPSPIALDVTGDGKVDFTIFVELTAGSQGDRLYAGINPLGPNLVKSGPAIEDNFLSMGFLISEKPGSAVSAEVEAGQRWTSDYGAFMIRNTPANSDVFYEGNWANGDQIVGIRNYSEEASHFGWLRLEFDKATESVTLIDYAYEATSGQPIVAGHI